MLCVCHVFESVKLHIPVIEINDMATARHFHITNNEMFMDYSVQYYYMI